VAAVWGFGSEIPFTSFEGRLRFAQNDAGSRGMPGMAMSADVDIPAALIYNATVHRVLLQSIS